MRQPLGLIWRNNYWTDKEMIAGLTFRPAVSDSMVENNYSVATVKVLSSYYNPDIVLFYHIQLKSGTQISDSITKENQWQNTSSFCHWFSISYCTPVSVFPVFSLSMPSSARRSTASAAPSIISSPASPMPAPTSSSTPPSALSLALF